MRMNKRVAQNKRELKSGIQHSSYTEFICQANENDVRLNEQLRTSKWIWAHDIHMDVLPLL